MCEPYRGSESEVGWRWATGLADQGYDITLLTRSTHQEDVLTEALRAHPSGHRITLVAFDLAWQPAPAYNTPRGIRFHYLLWQLKALKIARELQHNTPFDLVHHVTLASVRQPSFLGHLNVPLIFGPVGGGEQAPKQLLKGAGIDGQINGIVRRAWNAYIRFDPILRQNFRRADVIFCTSRETQAVMPAWAQEKSIVHLAVALDPSELPVNAITLAEARPNKQPGLRIINAGRFLHWKAMHLGFRAFARLLKTHPNARLSMVGEGPKESDWRELTHELGIADSVDWFGWIGRSELLEAFSKHDICLYPSLHDSGGFVVLEAMAQALPVVCMNLGGPGQMVDHTSGRVIDARVQDADGVVSSMSDALIELANDQSLRLQLGRGARQRATKFTWENLREDIYGNVVATNALTNQTMTDQTTNESEAVPNATMPGSNNKNRVALNDDNPSLRQSLQIGSSDTSS